MTPDEEPLTARFRDAVEAASRAWFVLRSVECLRVPPAERARVTRVLGDLRALSGALYAEQDRLEAELNDSLGRARL